MVQKESPERAQRAEDDVFHEAAGRAWTHRTRSWRSTKLFTTIKSNEMMPRPNCPMEDEASWVIKCKDDHEEEITQFDGEDCEEDDDQRDFHILEQC